MSVKVALVYHGPRMMATEHKVHGHDGPEPSPTLNRIRTALVELGHVVVLVDGTKDLMAQISDQSPDIVFNLYAVAGGTEQCFVPAVLDQMGVPYTGSDALGHALAMHKGVASRLFAAAKLPTPRFAVLRAGEQLALNGVEYPAIVKPCTGGASEGIEADSFVRNANELEPAAERILKSGQDVLVSQYVEGRELTIGLIGNHGDLCVLPMLEKHLDAWEGEPRIFTGSMNWHEDVSVPELSPDAEQTVEDTAVRAFHAVGLRDYGRVDIRLSPDGTPYVLEVNSMPALFPNFSAMTRIAKEMNWQQVEGLAHAILRAAMDRCGLT